MHDTKHIVQQKKRFHTNVQYKNGLVGLID